MKSSQHASIRAWQSANALSLGAQNSNCSEMLAPKLKSILPQEWSNGGRRLYKGRKIIKNVLI